MNPEATMSRIPQRLFILSNTLLNTNKAAILDELTKHVYIKNTQNVSIKACCNKNWSFLLLPDPSLISVSITPSFHFRTMDTVQMHHVLYVLPFSCC